jgi:hypothetical protein
LQDTLVLWSAQFVLLLVDVNQFLVSFLRLTVACIKTNMPKIAARAVQVAETPISMDKWPKYYHTKRQA